MKLESMELLFGDAHKNGNEPIKTMNTNIAITAAVAEKERLSVDFEYTATYAPDGSHIRVGGKGVFSGPEAKKAGEEWAGTGRISGSTGELIMNAINYTASLNAVLLAKAFNLPPPVILADLVFEGK